MTRILKTVGLKHMRLLDPLYSSAKGMAVVSVVALIHRLLCVGAPQKYACCV